MVTYFRTKDKRTRGIISAAETHRTCLRYLVRSSFMSHEAKQRICAISSGKLNRALTFSVKNRNRCALTERAGSVFRYFRLSRIMLKQLASRGALVGIQKSSW